MEPSERDPLVKGSVQCPNGTRTYFRRWYILFVFTVLAILQAMTWNTWGPIADTAKAVYDWTPADVALLSNWGPITYVTSAFFFSWLMESKGLRIAVLLSGSSMFLGTVLRCLPVNHEYVLWVMHPGQLFIGLAGPVMMAGPAVLSAAWFPSYQRTTATAIGAMAGYLGVSFSFIIGPQIVHDVNNSTRCNASTVSTMTSAMNDEESILYDVSPEEKHRHILEINHLMYLECGITALFFFAAVIYFPSKPPLPPSTSASVNREDFLKGVKALFFKWEFLAPALAYGIFSGVYGGWTTEMTSILDSIGVNQDAAGWMGFGANLAGCAGGLVFSRLVDLLGGKVMKLVILSLTVLSLGIWVWIIMICGNYIHFSTAHVWISYIATGFFVGSLIPLFYEICAEGAYPIGESSTTGFITWLNNAACLLFLLVALFESLGYAWMNWSMLCSVFLVIPLLLCYKERYNRLEIDVTNG